MRGWFGVLVVSTIVAAPAALAEPPAASGHSASRCGEVLRARAQLASDRRSHQRRLEDIERTLQARRVRYQLRTELLRAQLRKQYQSGVALKPEQEQQLRDAEQRSREMGIYSADEQQQITRTRELMNRLEGDYRQKHGDAWTACPQQAAAPLAGTYAVAQRPSH